MYDIDESHMVASDERPNIITSDPEALVCGTTYHCLTAP